MDREFKVDIEKSDRAVTVRLQGRFDHGATHAFRLSALKGMEGGASRVVVDCSGLNYIDSTAMGELIYFRNIALKKSMTVVLARSAGLVREALLMGNFQKIFEME